MAKQPVQPIQKFSNIQHHAYLTPEEQAEDSACATRRYSPRQTPIISKKSPQNITASKGSSPSAHRVR